MAYDIRLFKLVTGEVVMGKYDESKDQLNDVATLQTINSKQGTQMLLIPYGYPFEPKFEGSIEGKNFIYRYANTPEELQNKYIEACTKLTMSGGMGSLNFNPQNNPAESKIIK